MPAGTAGTSQHASAEEVVQHSELTTFQTREAYVYKIPPASTVGHRAEMWDVDHWLQEVSAAVVSCQDECWVRLFDKATGELFAECPIPQDRPLVTVVEPVVDSSRYYVLRIVDRVSGRHAFIGMGFRERNQASDFNAALDDHLQYLRKKREVVRMKEEYAAAAAAADNADAGSGGGGGGVPGPARDMALRPGQTIKVALPTRATDGASTTPPTSKLGSMAAKARLTFFNSPTPVKMSAVGSRMGGGGPEEDSPPTLLPPPPRPRFTPPPAAATPPQHQDDPASPTAAGAAWDSSATSPAAVAADAHVCNTLSPGLGFMAVSPKHPAGSGSGGGGGPGGSAAGLLARFRLSKDEAFEGQESESRGGGVGGQSAGRLANALCTRSMRVSMALADDDAASDAASLANLSMKAHGSGGSSLVGSSTYSDGGNSEADEATTAESSVAAEAGAAGGQEAAGDSPAAEHEQAAATGGSSAEGGAAAAPGQGSGSPKHDWGDFVS